MKYWPNLIIVDDNNENLYLLVAFIRKIKVNIIQATSGNEALEKAKGVEIALAIIDVQMPEMNGYELAVKLNEGRPDNKIPVIFLTANYFSETEVNKGYSSGAVDYIFKPVNHQILLGKINVFLDLFNQKQIIISKNRLLRKSAKELTRTNNIIKKREEKLQQEQLFTKALLDSIPGIFYLYTFPGLRLVTWNKQHETLFGFEPSEMSGRHVLDWHVPENKQAVMDSLKDFMHIGQSSIETPLVTKDGRLLPFLLTAVKFESNGQHYLIGIGTDVTERKQAEKALLQSEATLKKAQQIAQIGSWELDIATHELLWSDEIYRILGYLPQTVNPNLEIFLKRVHPEDISLLKETMKTARETMKPFGADYRIITATGEEHIVHEQAELLFDDAGIPEKWMGTIQDITERKRIEDELKSSLEQLKQLSKYIEQVRENERISISRELHDDLGQALTAVKIDLGLIRQKISDNELVLKISNVTNLVGETIKSVQRITSQLRPEIIDDLGLEAAIEWYTGEFAKRTGIEVLLEIEKGMSISNNESLPIFRIMQESLTNIARHAKANHVKIGLKKEGELIQFRISDNGIGIKEDKMKSKNSFGLISMSERAASLGGTFEIYPKKDDFGTVIKITFPLK